MLYDLWRDVVRRSGAEIALILSRSGQRWTFNELDRLVDAQAGAGASDHDPRGVLFLQSASEDFLVQLLRAWRDNIAVCPLEPGQPPPVLPPPPSGIVHLKTTSASTGAGRVAAFTAGQLAADAANIIATMGLRPDWPNLGVISLAHSYGFSSLVTPLLLHGIPLILPGSALPETVRGALDSFPAVTLPAVPAMWRAWHEAGVLSGSVRLAISAGAGLPLPLEKGVFEAAGIKLHNFYGATECGGIAFDASGEPRTDEAEIGAPLRNVGLSCSASGLLEVRGDAVGECYWPDRVPGLSARCFTTSDLVDLREGRVFLRGREGDQINVAGRKVSPEAIELLLASHPDVRACVVFGVPSHQAGREEDIVACVAAAGGSAEALRAFLSSRVAGWKLPRDWWFVDELGVSGRGKISRAAWRQRYLERHPPRPGSVSTERQLG